ncbi:MAG TPA: hypothetical protein VGD46_17030 [Rhizobacter sp.]
MQNLLSDVRSDVRTFGDVTDAFDPLATQDLLVTMLHQLPETLDKPLPALRDIKLSKENAKWRAISSLQKAVRRGHTTNALMMASALINSDQEDHLLKRLCTIALEDVAFGAPVLCAQVFAFAASAKIRSQVGGWPMLLALIEQLCEATKDRIPCEIAVSAGYSPEDDEYKLEMYARDTDDLIGIASDVTNHWQDVQTATRMLSGHLKLNGDYANKHRDMTSFRAVFADCPPLIRYIAHRSAAGGGESAALVSGMRLGWHLLFNHKDAEPMGVEGGLIEEPQVVRGVLLEALDMHTTEGKTAFKRLLAAEGQALADWVDDLGGNPAEALGNGVFMAEGKVCNLRLQSPDTDKITHLSHEAQMGRAGLPKDQLGKLLAQVSTLLPALNEHRRKVLLG